MKTIEEMMVKLPHLNYEKDVVNDWGYSANLYHFDGEWHCDFISVEEGDILLNFSGNTPTDAVTEAYNYCKQRNILIEKE